VFLAIARSVDFALVSHGGRSQIQEGGSMSMPMMPSAALGVRRQQPSETKAVERYLCFGHFQVDLQRQELFKQGSRVRIPSKVFQVLLALVERPGEIVTREALRARLWPGGTFVNYDANVNTTVNKLRLALGDSPEKPRYVETIPRQGYCFLGSVERGNELLKTSGGLAIAAAEAVDRLAAPQAASPIIAKKIISSRFAPLFANGWGAAVLLCGMLIGVGIVLLMHRPS
jgi:DNA-binding winged helix-turn-helix (wHTH) protein